MKKFVVFASLVVFILTSGIVYADKSTDINTIDIGLYYGSHALDSVELVCNGEAFIVNAADITDDIEYVSEDTITAQGKEYKGSIILKKDANGLLTVINRVDMEDYIAAVTAVEMSPSWHIEALKTQAVCARTYAMRNMNKHGKYVFDLCSTVDCQAYKGVSAASESTIQAAQETAGQFMTYDGQVIDAVYSATSGGWTEDVKNVWGSNLPYLTAVEDLYESKDCYGSSWTKEVSVEKATEIMNNKGYEIGTVKSITIDSVTEHGAVTQMTVKGTEGEKTFKREGCRLAFGSVVLSQAFTVTPKRETGSVKEAFFSWINQRLAGEVSVSEMSFNTIHLVQRYLDIPQTQTNNSPVTSFTFKGRGYGHLVGMSQNGAKGMAEAGFDYEDILKHYYTGIEIQNITKEMN